MQTQANVDYSLLRIYAYYRALLSSLLLLMFSASIAPNVLGVDNPRIFEVTIILYTGISFLTLAILWWRQFAPTAEHLFALLLIDIVALIFMSHASGGVDSGLGFLLLITTAAAGIFLSAQLSTALAAIASLLAIAETLYRNSEGLGNSLTTFNAGVLGIMLFASALIFNYLSVRLRASTEEAESQARQARRLAKLSQLIVEKMQTGVIVSSSSGDIELINRSATQLLDWPQQHKKRCLEQVPELEEQVQLWQSVPQSRGPSMRVKSQDNSVRLNFAELSPNSNTETLIFVEDNRALDREAQQLKLASLGRLTGSIAHEIRNPLSAISHAGQLLAESESISDADLRLTEIITNHCLRVNQIIENVMQLSRRGTTQPEQIDLAPWLVGFIKSYSSQDDNINLVLRLDCEVINTKVDVSHLQQILTNLFDNGLRYSELATGEQHLTIKSGVNPESDLPYLEVIDDGSGIPEDLQDKVFEPFYTTETAGSGLGLYLSKELCQANHATLSYRFDENDKSCFRIIFSHPNRVL